MEVNNFRVTTSQLHYLCSCKKDSFVRHDCVHEGLLMIKLEVNTCIQKKVYHCMAHYVWTFACTSMIGEYKYATWKLSSGFEKQKKSYMVLKKI